MHIRAAVDSEGEAIRALVVPNAPHFASLDWSRVTPDWIVAEQSGRVVGALQVHLGRPIARFEFLALDLALPKRQKVAAIRNLLWFAASLAAKYGSQVVAGLVSTEDKWWQRFLCKHGGSNMGEKLLYMWRIK